MDAKWSPLPNSADLRELFQQKNSGTLKIGWAPRRRVLFGYFQPADIYEACIWRCIYDGCSWIDIGGGRNIFPDNPALARLLVSRCRLTVAVDPSENVYGNEFVHQRERCRLEDYNPDRVFDIATLRMVVEHIQEPKKFMHCLRRILRPGGIVVVFTVNKMSPIPLLSRIVPFRLHYTIKKVFWGGEEEDTFPVYYEMNSRNDLRCLFEAAGFRELAFAHLDDLSAFAHFKTLNMIELSVWKALNMVGIRYPENCLLGVYSKQEEPHNSKAFVSGRSG